jgi:hypothetical protein
MLEVHHRRYPENWGEETVYDLTTLCHNCHARLAHPSRSSFPGLFVALCAILFLLAVILSSLVRD